jgi:hypothetical protein
MRTKKVAPTRRRRRLPAALPRAGPPLAGLGRGAPAALPMGGALGGGPPGLGAAGAIGGGALPGMKKGGKVKKTGPHILHKGEHVTPAHKGKKPSPRKR